MCARDVDWGENIMLTAPESGMDYEGHVRNYSLFTILILGFQQNAGRGCLSGKR
jgi:hypothetical protein